jgi:hypothetical protein
MVARDQVGRLPRPTAIRRPIGFLALPNRPRMLGRLPRAREHCRCSWRSAGNARRRAGLPPQGRPAGLHALAKATDRQRPGLMSSDAADLRCPAPGRLLHASGPVRGAARTPRGVGARGPAWRTSKGLRVDDPPEFLAGLEELGLEGAVAKRLGSSYTPGRRSRSWIKQKLHREERLEVTGVRRTSEGTAEAVFVARPRPDGSLTSAGSIELGLGRELIDQLERRLAELPPGAGAPCRGIRPRCQ